MTIPELTWERHPLRLFFFIDPVQRIGEMRPESSGACSTSSSPAAAVTDKSVASSRPRASPSCPGDSHRRPLPADVDPELELPRNRQDRRRRRPSVCTPTSSTSSSSTTACRHRPRAKSYRQKPPRGEPHLEHPSPFESVTVGAVLFGPELHGHHRPWQLVHTRTHGLLPYVREEAAKGYGPVSGTVMGREGEREEKGLWPNSIFSSFCPFFSKGFFRKGEYKKIK